MYFSMPHSHTPSTYSLPLMWNNTTHIHTKQQAKLVFYILIFIFFDSKHDKIFCSDSLLQLHIIIAVLESTVTRLRKCCSCSQQEQEVSLCSETNRPSLRPIQPPIQCVVGDPPPGEIIKLTQWHQVPRLRMYEAILPLPTHLHIMWTDKIMKLIFTANGLWSTAFFSLNVPFK